MDRKTLKREQKLKEEWREYAQTMRIGASKIIEDWWLAKIKKYYENKNRILKIINEESSVETEDIEDLGDLDRIKFNSLIKFNSIYL